MKTYISAEYSTAVSEAWLKLSSFATSFIQMHEWVSAIPKYFSGELNLNWIYLEDELGPAALVVLSSQTVRYSGFLKVEIFRSVNPRGILHADMLLRPNANVNDTLTAFCKTAADGRRRWDVLDLKALRSQSSLLKLSSLLPDALVESSTDQGVAVIDTSGTWQEWQATLSTSFLADLRKSRGRLDRSGEVSFRMFMNSTEEVMEGLSQFMNVEAAGWKRDSGALTNDPADHGIIHSALQQLAPIGKGGVLGLYLDSRMVAGYVWIRAGSTLYALKTAYAEDLSRMSPGKVLTAELIKHCFEQGDVDKLDFCARADWHMKFGVVIEPTFSVRAYNPHTLLGRLGALKARLSGGR